MKVRSFEGKLPGLHWLILAVTAVLCVLVAAFVDLKPQVSENLFFSWDEELQSFVQAKGSKEIDAALRKVAPKPHRMINHEA